jgi:hypothetical protein
MWRSHIICSDVIEVEWLRRLVRVSLRVVSESEFIDMKATIAGGDCRESDTSNSGEIVYCIT